jgi:hypothetical protein
MLIGKWGADIPGSPDCVAGGSFFVNESYEADTICPLADGSYGIEAELGTYSADGSVIDLVPTQASCREPSRDHGPSERELLGDQRFLDPGSVVWRRGFREAR